MKLKPIKSKKEYDALPDRVDEIFDRKAKANSPEGGQLQIALLLMKKYEDDH